MMLKKYKSILEETQKKLQLADEQGAIETYEYFDGQVEILKQIIVDLENK